VEGGLSDVIGVAEVLIGTVGLVAALLIYRWQRYRKGLGVAVLTDRPLLMTPSPFAVSVHHDGKVVAEPRLIVVRIANTGNVPIEASDFERSLSMTFPQCEVLSAEVTGVRPAELTATLRTDGPTITLEPCLLNPTDLIEVQCLVDGSTELQVDCRVVGVRSVEKVNLPRDSWGKVWRVSTVEVVAMSLMPVLGIGLAVGLFLSGNPTIGLVVLIGGIVWFWIDLRTIRKSRLWLALPPPQGH
jgi:hypothetical protein